MLKICKKLQEKRFVFVKILAIIIPENGAKVSKIKCLRLNQQTLIIDPYFRYHEPLYNYGYTFYRQRYSNDGIVRNFDYDAYIVGTSMTENFKTSEASAVFGYNFIKVPYSGGYYKELDQAIQSRRRPCVYRNTDDQKVEQR